jgi:DNA polymerase III gamma/tau subunit
MQLLYDLADRITAYDEKGALMQLRAILDAGADTRTLIKDLADIFRRIMWLSVGADSDEPDEQLIPLAQRFGKAASIRALDLLIKKEYEMRINLRADIVLETAVMGIMAPEDDNKAAPALRLDKLEARLRSLESRGSIAAPSANAPEPAPTPKKTAEKKEPAATGSAHKTMAGAADMTDAWAKILTALKEEKYFVYTHAQKAHNVLKIGQTLELKFDSAHDVEADYMKQAAAQNAVLKELKKLTGESLSISVVTETAASEEPLSADILRMFGTDIEQI